MKVTLDKEKCTLCLSCVTVCPEVFESKEDGTVDVKDEYKGVEITDEALKEKIRGAAEICPTQAIEITGE